MRADADIAQLILESLSPTERDALTRLASARRFDQDVFRVLCRASASDGPDTGDNGVVPLIDYQHLIDLPIVERLRSDSDEYVINPSVREVLLEQLSSEDRRAMAVRLAALYQDHDEPDEALYHLFTADPEAAMTRLGELFEAADARFDLARCHALVALAERQLARISGRISTETAAAASRRVRALGRRLDARRRWADERYNTVYYVERTAVVEALEDLLAPDTNTWLLHVHAPGGRGKSMFIDATISRLCAPDIPCVKIDLDEYHGAAHAASANREPWRLILTLAEQLAVQLEDAALADLVSEYRDLTGPRDVDAKSGPFTDAITREIAGRFAGMVTDHIGSGPLLLVFDADDDVLFVADAEIERTVSTLVGLRELIPGLRVILAGRDNLATRMVSLAQRFTDEARVVEIPPFSRAEAEIYLRERRGIDEPELVAAIAEQAAGDPIELSLLADEVARDPTLDADAVRAFPDAHLFFLVNRVLERIDDRRVRWIVRWGALGPRLERGFFEQQLWPLLCEQLTGRAVIDQPENDPALLRERDTFKVPEPEAYESTPGDAPALWAMLEQYAAGSTWIAPAGRGVSGLSLHREVCSPMRAILRAHQPEAWRTIHERARLWWLERAHRLGEGARDVLLTAARAALFHALEATTGRDAVAQTTWNLIDSANPGDIELMAGLADEVYAADERRVGENRRGIEPALLLAASLARCVAAVAQDPIMAARHLAEAERLAELEHVLERATALCGATCLDLARGLSAAASGDAHGAKIWLTAVLDRQGRQQGGNAGDDQLAHHAVDELLAHHALAELTAAEQPDVSIGHRLQAWKLADTALPLWRRSTRAALWQQLMERERYDVVEPCDDMERMAYLLAVGRASAAAHIMHRMPLSRDLAHELDQMHAWLHIELGQPLRASAALGVAPGERGAGAVAASADPAVYAVWALMRAQLCDLEQALLYADLVLRESRDRKGAWQLAIALARVCIDHQAPAAAQGLLDHLDERAPTPDLAVARAAVQALASLSLSPSLSPGDAGNALTQAKPADELWRATESMLEQAGTRIALAPSVHVYRLLVAGALGWPWSDILTRVCDALEAVHPVTRRLRILDGLRSLSIDSALVPEALARRLRALVEPAVESAAGSTADTEHEHGPDAMQLLRWAAVLRFIGASEQANEQAIGVLCRVLDSCDPPVARMAWRELDRLGVLPERARPVALELYETESAFVGVVNLERAERLVRGRDTYLDTGGDLGMGTVDDAARSDIGALLDICEAKLPRFAVAPWGERISAVRARLRAATEPEPIEYAPDSEFLGFEHLGGGDDDEPDIMSLGPSYNDGQTSSQPAGQPWLNLSEELTPKIWRGAHKRHDIPKQGAHESAAITIAWASPTSWRVGLADGSVRDVELTGAMAALARPAADDWVADGFWRALPTQWRQLSHQLGQTLGDWLQLESLEPHGPGTVRILNRETHADFIPWGLAEWRGAPLSRFLAVVNAPSLTVSEPARTTEPASLIVVADDEPHAALAPADQPSWLDSYCDAGMSPLVSTAERATYGLASQIAGPVVLHLTGSMHISYASYTSRSRARVFLHLAETRLSARLSASRSARVSALDAAQLGRALSRAARALVILTVRTPASCTEQARQLVLRNVFASELARAHPGVTVLATGLAGASDHASMVATVVDRVVAGAPAVDMLRALQQRADIAHWRPVERAVLVSPEHARQLIDQALAAGLPGKRAQLLRGMERAVVRELSTGSSPGANGHVQLVSDLENLVRLANSGNAQGLHVWLDNAAAILSGPESAGFRQAVQGVLRQEDGDSTSTSVVCAFEHVLPFAGSALFTAHPEAMHPIRDAETRSPKRDYRDVIT